MILRIYTININRTLVQYVLHKKRSFPLRISSVNVTKSAVSCGFGHITEEILNGKLHFLCSDETSLGYPDFVFHRYP